MPFLRIEKKKSGTYLRILESYRNIEGKPTHRILHSLGKVEDYTQEQLQRIGLQLHELGGGKATDFLKGKIEELGRYNYGYQQIYGKAIKHYGLENLFKRLQNGSKIKFDFPNTLKLMLLERVQYPCSKLKNYVHQREYLNFRKVELHHIYRSLDLLSKNEEQIQRQIYQTGRDLFSKKLDVVFYDVTTFYFDSQVEKEGELRQMGFGKDGKIGRTQILFSMLIDKDKNPIGYKIFEGNTYEGDTFKEAIRTLKEIYQIDKVIVVADRGMLSKANIARTVEADFDYIMGERLKSLKREVQQILLNKKEYKKEWVYMDHDSKQIHIKYTILEYDNKTIICTYSENRAKKDKKDREKRIEKAKKLLKNPSSLKSKSNRYFIKSESTEKYELDEAKIKRQEKYDGLMAISTNTTLGVEKVLEQYKQLYKIEHSFRTLKSHLELRPMFHWTDKRIKGHICMCYLAFTLQNWILNKANEKKKIFTESTLRAILDKMQVSHIKNNKNELYIRSKPSKNETYLQRQIGVKALMPMIPPDRLVL